MKFVLDLAIVLRSGTTVTVIADIVHLISQDLFYKVMQYSSVLNTSHMNENL